MMFSLIVSTYNRPDALERVLLGLNDQLRSDFEVIVADDGSSDDTVARASNLESRLDYPFTLVRQEHRGFHAARARNLAVLRASGDYLIFLDGDCVPFPDFIDGHARLAEPRRFVAGNRILLSRSFTERVLRDGLPVTKWSRRSWIAARLKGDVPRFSPLFRLPLGPLRSIRRTRWEGAKTCNLGVWRRDFFEIDGFDESYKGWGHEDADLVARLIHAGVERKDGRFAVPVLHLWHPQADRSMLEDNERRLEHVLESRAVKAWLGISHHHVEAP
jgi:glycosyltransferase involved in cell wall biosynthesis